MVLQGKAQYLNDPLDITTLSLDSYILADRQSMMLAGKISAGKLNLRPFIPFYQEQKVDHVCTFRKLPRNNGYWSLGSQDIRTCLSIQNTV